MKTSRTNVCGFVSAGAIIAVAGVMLSWISPAWAASVLINTYAGQGTTVNQDSANYYVVPTALSAAESNITVTQSTSTLHFPASRLVDGSGLHITNAIASPTNTTPPFVGTPPGMSRVEGTGDTTQMWLSDKGVSSDIAHIWLDFSLPGIKDLTSMSVWNYNSPSQQARNVLTAYIWYSTTANPAVVNAGEVGGVAPDGLLSGSAWTMLGSGVQNFTSSDATDSTTPYTTPDSFSFSGTPTGITHVFIDIETDGVGGATPTLGSTQTVGLSEVQFFGDLPEPASLSLLGVGAIALLKRRRA